MVHVSDSSQNPNISNKIIDLLVNDILNKNGINLEKAKGKLTSEQKQMLKELVSDLTNQVDTFIKHPTAEKQNESK